MGYLIAIESDPKCFKEIQESWGEVAKELNHEVLIFKTFEECRTQFLKPEFANKVVLIVMITLEETQGDVAKTVTEIKEKFKCDTLLSVFEDPLKPFRKSSTLPVQNILFKPFDLTILKEHTRFALLHGQKARTQYVHTTQVNAEIELLKKFKILQMAEFGFKIDKFHKLEKGKAYKFYHPLFANKKNQHIWARCFGEDENSYELLFCQIDPVVLSQIRKKVATSPTKVKNPTWLGLTEENKQETIKVAIQIAEEATEKTYIDLLERNFTNLTFIANKDIDPKQKLECDVLITEMQYDTKGIEGQFTKKPLIIRIYDKPIPRAELELNFEFEFLRFEKPLDKALLVKMLKLYYPALKEKEEIPKLTAQMDEFANMTEIIKIQDFSEAAILFNDTHKFNLGQIVDISLPQEDESNIQEIKAKVHFVSEKYNNDKEKLYTEQFVLFGMKDEHLKLIRLWALKKHIDKKK